LRSCLFSKAEPEMYQNQNVFSRYNQVGRKIKKFEILEGIDFTYVKSEIRNLSKVGNPDFDEFF